MPVVSPFAVASTLDAHDQGDMLVFAMDALVAMHRCLIARHRVTKTAQRAKMISAGKVEAAVLSPYALGDMRDDAFRQVCYAASAEDALAFGKTRWPDRAERIVIGPADDMEVLMALPDRELVDQAAFIWPGREPGGLLHRRCPYAWAVKAKGRPMKAPMTLTARLQVASAIQLAMLIEHMGTPEAAQFTPMGIGKTPHMARAKKLGLHGENIPVKIIDEMLLRIGPTMERFDDAVTALMERFCKAYGYRAEDMRWVEIAALWAEGPAGLERARIDGTLGRYAYFRHRRAPRYRGNTR